MPKVCESLDNTGTASDQEMLRMKQLAAYCQGFRGGELRRSLVQLGTTFGLFFAAIATMFAAFHHGHAWLYALLLPPAAGLVVRLFIIQHDCGHGAFFASARANDWMGRVLSLFTFIPYGLWRRAHNLHHAGSGNLERRGAGAIDTLTVREYQGLDSRRRLLYRIYRHPLLLLLIGPPIYILLLLRFPPPQSVPFLHDYHPLPVKEAWSSVMALNIVLLLVYGGLIAAFGWKTGLLAYVPVIVCAFWVGQWLFFIQHQYEDAYWQHQEEWNYLEAALHGSSYYKLPRVLQWFTGNIGFHHIHHLCPGIPNYRLEECFAGNSGLSDARRITLRDGLRAARLALWDEEHRRMVRFRDIAATT